MRALLCRDGSGMHLYSQILPCKPGIVSLGHSLSTSMPDSRHNVRVIVAADLVGQACNVIMQTVAGQRQKRAKNRENAALPISLRLCLNLISCESGMAASAARGSAACRLRAALHA